MKHLQNIRLKTDETLAKTPEKLLQNICNIEIKHLQNIRLKTDETLAKIPENTLFRGVSPGPAPSLTLNSTLP